jgi:hypothetical protein
LAALDDQHPLKRLRRAHVVGNAEQGGFLPQAARACQQLPPLLTVEPTERLIQNHQPHPRPEQRPPQPHPLPFPTGDQPSPLAEQGLETVGKLLQHIAQLGLLDDGGERRGVIAMRSIAQVLEQRAIPELHSRIDPGGFLA